MARHKRCKCVFCTVLQVLSTYKRYHGFGFFLLLLNLLRPIGLSCTLFPQVANYRHLTVARDKVAATYSTLEHFKIKQSLLFQLFNRSPELLKWRAHYLRGRKRSRMVSLLQMFETLILYGGSPPSAGH